MSPERGRLLVVLSLHGRIHTLHIVKRLFLIRRDEQRTNELRGVITDRINLRLHGPHERRDLAMLGIEDGVDGRTLQRVELELIAEHVPHGRLVPPAGAQAITRDEAVGGEPEHAAHERSAEQKRERLAGPASTRRHSEASHRARSHRPVVP